MSSEEERNKLPKERENDLSIDIVGRSLMKTLDASKFIKILLRDLKNILRKITFFFKYF